MYLEERDYCSCPKPPEVVGRVGFHLRVATEIDQKLLGFPVGQPLAYERCPQWQAEWERNRRQNEAKEKGIDHKY